MGARSSRSSVQTLKSGQSQVNHSWPFSTSIRVSQAWQQFDKTCVYLYVLMRASKIRRLWRICRGSLTRKSLLLNCLHDGEVYGGTLSQQGLVCFREIHDLIIRKHRLTKLELIHFGNSTSDTPLAEANYHHSLTAIDDIFHNK